MVVGVCTQSTAGIQKCQEEVPVWGSFLLPIASALAPLQDLSLYHLLQADHPKSGQDEGVGVTRQC